VAAAISHEWDPGQEFGTRVYVNNADFGYDNGGSGPAGRVDEGSSKHRTLAAFSKNRVTSNWTSTITLSQSETERDDMATNIASPNHMEYKGTTNMFQWNNEIVLMPDWTATVGATRSREKAAITAWSNLDRSRSNYSLYGGVNGKIQAHGIQANLRYDHVGDSGSDTTAYLGYGYDLTSSWKVIASASTAFLAPTLYQLYDSGNGNPNLKAERSRSKEAGIQYASGSTLVRTVFFETDTSDLIDWVSTGGWTGKYFNVGKAKNHGMEVTASTRWRETDLRASLTLQSPVDKTTGTALSRRAKTLASLAASRSLGLWRVGGDIQYVGHRDDSQYNTYELSSYLLANLNVRYQINREVSVYGRIENLLDRDYQTAYGYDQPSRGCFAGIEWRE
jgi:vitamin B12 transporter